jgi:hypothetical protein
METCAFVGFHAVGDFEGGGPDTNIAKHLRMLDKAFRANYYLSKNTTRKT